MNLSLPDHALYSVKYQLKIKEAMRFEFTSLVGRMFFNRKPPLIDHVQNLLNLGCGLSIFEGWVNADFFILKQWRKIRVNWQLDLRYPLKCDCNYWDGIFSEHTLEHLHPVESLHLLRELYRTLKPGCWLRLSVPDLEKYINYYCGKEVDTTFTQNWPTGAEAMRSLTQNWGHFSVWDTKLLTKVLNEVGFTEIRKVSFGEGTDKRLIKELKAREWESLYIEARKPVHE